MTSSSLPDLVVRAPDGAHARVLLDGAQVVSWIPAGSSDDRLFLSRRAEFGRGRSARGGIPICFPQFGPFGALPQHGFARNVRWAVSDETRRDEGEVRLQITNVEVAQQRPAAEVMRWPHEFSLEAIVRAEGDALSVRLLVTNTGTHPFAFTAALHPYFAVRDARWYTSRGYRASLIEMRWTPERSVREEASSPLIAGALDRIYYGAPDELFIRDAHRALRIEKSGFPDAVVWNPSASITASKPDFEAGDEARMLCVEAAVIGTPVTLGSGEKWGGVQRIVAI